MYARDANDREQVELVEGRLRLEVVEVEQVCQFRLVPRRTRVELPVLR